MTIYYTDAVFQFSQSSYSVTEEAGAVVMVVVQLTAGSGELTTDTEVTVITADIGGAEGIIMIVLNIYY